jgi:hypothetical protein
MEKAAVMAPEMQVVLRTPTPMVPETQMALRTPTPRAPERLPKPSPRRAMAHKPVKKVRQGRMVLVPEALQRRTVQRLPTNEVG